MAVDYEAVMEKEWGRALVHESGHALVAVLKNIPCHGIYYQFLDEKGKFCALANIADKHAELLPEATRRNSSPAWRYLYQHD